MSDINPCPICKHSNSATVDYCANCGWQLSLNYQQLKINQPSAKFGLSTLKEIEAWAKRVWQESHPQSKTPAPVTNHQELSLLNLQDKIAQLEQNLQGLSLSLEEKITETIAKEISNIKEKIKSKQQKIVEKIKDLEKRQTSLSATTNSVPKASEIEKANLFTSNVITKESLGVDASTDLDREEDWIIQHYNQDTNALLTYAQSVSVTETSVNEIWKSKANQIIFEESFDENEYWLLQVENSSNIYLVPSHNLRINTNFKVIKNIFKLDNYSLQNEQNEYNLVKPAKVITSGTDTWKLIEKGILNFE